jgi:hypothetical protein
MSFYKSGALASCEPASPVSVETPLGIIEAHDPDPDGLKEAMSLSFTENGELAGLSTIKTVVNSMHKGHGYSFGPTVERSMCSDTEFNNLSLKIAFREDIYTFRNGLRPTNKVSAFANFSLATFQTNKKLSVAKCSA